MTTAEDGAELEEQQDHTWSWTRLTMNYVGQLAGQVFVQVKELYRGLNPATLSGCIDVIVVRRPDGSLQCSPFHVRFGKLGVLRSREKVVDMEINGEPVDLHMKLGDNGEAFFVQETENDQEVVPSYLATSPILSDDASLMRSSGPPVQTLGSLGGETKKRRKRRRKSRADSVRREESGDYSADDDDVFSIEMSSDDDDRSLRDETTTTSTGGSYKQTSLYTRSDGEWSPIQRFSLFSLFFSSSPGNSRPASPKSDSELVTKSSDADGQNPAMLWSWGELPQAATPSFLRPVSIPISENTHFRVISHQMLEEAVAMETETLKMEMETSGGAGMMVDVEETTLRPVGKTDSPSQRKDKRSRHLGSDGVYLDDITDLEPEVAALYFPKSDSGATFRSVSDPGLHSSSLSPQSTSSGGDSGVDSFCDQMSNLPSINISLCGGLTDSREITKEQFQEKMISYQQFTDNPSIIDDPNLVVKIGSKYYNWSTAAPLVLAMQVFQKPLPKVQPDTGDGVTVKVFPLLTGNRTAAVENIMKEKMPKKGGRWWFSWRGRNSSGSKTVNIIIISLKNHINTPLQRPGLLLSFTVHKEESSSSDEDHQAAKQTSVQSEAGIAAGGVSYKKTLRLTSDQLLSLQLQEGPNDVVFSVTTQYQGTCRCQGTIYLWNWDDKIIISDIDGTITRSDTLGHILPTLGKDWTHQGIAQLYHKVSQNGYKFLYCSARAIGMADMTRGYLHWVNERGTMLPVGPVLLSPSSLFSALHREVIEKKPEKFKVECLTDIKNLFYPNTQPFYAAFDLRPVRGWDRSRGRVLQEDAQTDLRSAGETGNNSFISYYPGKLTI
uniref:phosphatidate phosphatase n=1 Tax=Amphiprion ocellaris TaxID=80972 RepID=A0AAQ5YX69_AMPOC